MKDFTLILSVILLNCSFALAQNQPADEVGLQQWTRLRVFSGHIDSVHGVAFSPDNRLLALTADIRGRIYFYDLIENRWAGALNTNNSISGMAFSPDGKMLAVAGYDDMTVTIWSNPASDISK